MPETIFLPIAAPGITRQGQVSSYVTSKVTSKIDRENLRFTDLLVSSSTFIDQTRQLIQCWQPPVGVSRQMQLAAVTLCLVPCDRFAVIFRRPHESGGWIDPVFACLRLLCVPSVFSRGLSTRRHDRSKKRKQDKRHSPLHDARSKPRKVVKAPYPVLISMCLVPNICGRAMGHHCV